MRESAFVLVLCTLLYGCATAPTTPAPTTERAPGIYRVSDGERLSRPRLWSELADARFVLVAESHDSERDHAIQLQVLEALHSHRRRIGGDVALGMEMFQRPFQPALDRYLAGEVDEDEMLDQTEWEERWGFETDLYRPLWRFAAEKKFPVLALNARRELIKRIAAVGIEGLTDHEQADLPEIDLTSERYRHWMREIFRAHGSEMESEAFERFFEAQVTWDETMAETAVRWAREHPDATVVIVVGRGHVERDFGIPSRIRRRVGARRGDGTVVSIVPVPADEVPRFRWMRRERFADYVWAR